MRAFVNRYPCLTILGLLILEIVCWWWLLTHDGCLHPIENGIAAMIAFVEIPLGTLGVLETITDLPTPPSNALQASAATRNSR